MTIRVRPARGNDLAIDRALCRAGDIARVADRLARYRMHATQSGNHGIAGRDARSDRTVRAQVSAVVASLDLNAYSRLVQRGAIMPGQTISNSNAIERASPSRPGNSEALVIFIRYSHFMASTRTLAGSTILCSSSSLAS